MNDRIGELVERAGWAAEGDFLCECGDPDCRRRVTLRLHEFEVVRRRGLAVQAPECGCGGRPTLRLVGGRSSASL